MHRQLRQPVALVAGLCFPTPLAAATRRKGVHLPRPRVGKRSMPAERRRGSAI